MTDSTPTDFAQKGFDDGPEATSDLTHGSSPYVAWRIGQWLREKGGPRPIEVVEEKGYAVRVDGVKIVIPAGATGEPYPVEEDDE